jgi:hypothetical protein
MAPMRAGRRWAGAAAGMLVLAGCASDPGPADPAECVRIVAEHGPTGDSCLPLSSREARVDLDTPAFSRPTEVTNPLLPTGIVRQAIYDGQVDGKPFRTEVTLLPQHKTIRWRGRSFEALTSQYFALSDGRVKEVALDRYAQADDGSVWYLGEDVANYADGKVADTEGTWAAGRKAPPAMIMPARPRVGDVYRSENAPGLVFEQDTVTAVNQTMPGPTGPVDGAITVAELQLDGSRESKTFAPGYGEFATHTAGEREQLALALPIDAASGPVPATMDTLATAIRRTADTLARGDWAAAATAAASVGKAWTANRPTDAPLPVLTHQMDGDVDSLTTAVADHDAAAARDAALRVAQNELDLRSRYEPVDTARFALWARQLIVDAAAGDTAAAAGDHACLKWTFERIHDEVTDPATVERTLSATGDALDRGDLTTAIAQAGTLADVH